MTTALEDLLRNFEDREGDITPDAYATARLTDSVDAGVQAMDDLRVMLKERLDKLINKLDD